jgi:hypothetical protein
MREQRVYRLIRFVGGSRQGKTHAATVGRAGSVQAACRAGLVGILGGNAALWPGEHVECWDCRRVVRRCGARVEGAL